MSDQFSRLLIDEIPLQFLPTLAVALDSVGEAIALQQLHFWLITKGEVIDGRKWCYNTYAQWRKKFPFWSERTIQRAFLNLEKKNIVITRQFDAHDWDRKKYYTIDYDALGDLIECNGTIERDKVARSANIDENRLKPDSANLSPSNTTKRHYQTGQFGTIKPDKLAHSYKEQRVINTENKSEGDTARGAEEVKAEDKSEAVQIVESSWKCQLGIFIQESIDAAQIEDVELWKFHVNLNKSSFDESRADNNTYKQRLVRYVLTDYFKEHKANLRQGTKNAAQGVSGSNSGNSGFKSKAEKTQDAYEQALAEIEREEEKAKNGDAR